MSLSVEITYREIEERYRTLQMYGLNIEKTQVESAKSLPSRWNKIFKKSKEVHFRVTPLKEKYTEITKMQILKFLKEVDTLETKFYESGPGSVGSALDEGLLLLRHFRSQLQETMEKGESLNKQEKLYVLPVTQFTILHTLSAEMDTLNEIYEAYQTYLDFEERWRVLTWRRLDLDLVHKEVVSVEEVLQNLKTKYEKAATLDQIVVRKDKSKKLFSVLRKLKESKLRPRHWREICTAAGITRDKDDDFDILNIWNVDLDLFGAKVHAVINLASNERTIEADLQEVKELWEATKFSINRISWVEGGDKFFCLGDVSKILDHLLVHDNMLDGMAKSEFSTHFSKEISYWKKTLCKIGEVTQEWVTVQNKWKDLSKAFAIKGFKDSLENGQGFEDLNKRFVRIMTETTKKPTVKDSCLVEDRYESLVSLKEELDIFQGHLSKALELRRKQFPRFFFLSDHELITVLGGSIRDPVVQMLVKKLFKKVSSFIPDELGIIEVIFSLDGEDLPLCKSVNTTIHPIETWLAELLEESKVSTKLLLRLAHKECELESPGFLRSLSKFANILIIAAFEMVWTEKFQTVLETGKNKHPNDIMEEWKNLYKMSINLFDQLAETTRTGNLSNAEKRKNMLILVLLLSKRDLIQNFLNNYIHTTGDFIWEKLLKYIWSKDSGHVQIEQCFSIIDYGYEFMGVDSVGIQNPESDKVWFQINEAIRNHNIPQLSGVPGTGKSQMIKDLASRLAKFCFNIHLNENFTMEAMTQFLRGICESNMWGNMENINLLKVSIMSVISSHFQTIKTAQTIHLREFTLDNQVTRMYPGVAFLCTENLVEGAPSLKKIPLSLRTLFRKTSVQLPDMQCLICSLLRVSAFKKPVTMSTNLVRAVEYVFQIVSLKEFTKLKLYLHIIQKAVKMMGEQPDVQEGYIFYSVLSEYFENLLPVLKFSLTKSFFQQTYEIEDPSVEITSEIPNIDSMFEKLDKTPNEKQSRFVGQIVENLAISKSVIVVGPVASGKSTIIDLSHVFYNEKISCKKHYLNCSTYNEPSILGDLSADGIVSNLLSDSDEQILFHIDTPFHESLAFPMSLLVDENEFMNGGGKMNVPKQAVKFLIETDNLENVCQSFICRSVIINVEECAESTPSLIIDRRLLKVEDVQMRNTLREIFEKLIDSVGINQDSDIDKYLSRTKPIKIAEMMDIFEAINTKSEYPHELVNYFVYAFFWAFSSCFSIDKKEKFLVNIRECIESNKSMFENCTVQESPMDNLIPMNNPLTDERASWIEQPYKETLVKLAVNLLKKNIPVLVVGERFGQEVYEEIQRSVTSTVPTTSICTFDLHALSSADSVISDLSCKLQKRGKSTLVPKESREILVAMSDLATTAPHSFDLIPSMIKDLLETKTLFINDHGYDVKDLNFLARVSPRGKCFQQKRILKKFVCLFAEDNFETSVNNFKIKLKEKCPENLHGYISKVGDAAKLLLETNQRNYSSFAMVLTSDIIVDILATLANSKEFATEASLEGEFSRQLNQTLVSPAIDSKQQQLVAGWIKKSLQQADIQFRVEYGITLTEDLFPADINPTEQQYQQCREVIHFLQSDQKCLSLYGNYGYGKTIVLTVATDFTGYSVDEVKSLDSLKISLLKTSDKLVVMLRDTYIENENMKEWLQAINSSENRHKIVFMMSPKTDNLVPWQQWILCRTQVVGIPYWTDRSLQSVLSGTDFCDEVKTTLAQIHRIVVNYCENSALDHEKVSITSGHFMELLARVQDSVDQKINCNKSKMEDLKSIVKSMKACKERISKCEKDLSEANNLLNNFKEELKIIKRETKSLNEGLENLSKDVDHEEKIHEDLKVDVDKLRLKHEEIKLKSFDDHSASLELIEQITVDEKIAFAKPLIVHEDIEKVCTILMILLKMDVFGWKPFKDKFLSDDWQGKLRNLNPDNCKHKQVFIINKKLKEIKSSKADLKNLSPIAGIFWDFIEGVLKAFTTEFDRSKLTNEIAKVQKKLDESHSKLNGLQEEAEKKKMSINERNLSFEKTTKSFNLKEQEAQKLQNTLKHEQNFISTSAFFLTDCERRIEEFHVDEKAALQEALIQETVGTYFGCFDTAQRLELLVDVKDTVRNLSEKNIVEENFLKNFDLLAIDADLTDNMSNLTEKRLLLCYDPNDLVALSLEREGEGGKQSIKLYDDVDIEKVKEYIKDEECSCILIEDAYFENKTVMNKLLDDNLYEIALEAEQQDKFIFVIVKVDNFCLPHKAYSKLYFLNLNLSFTEVIRLMTSQFNRHMNKEEDARLTELIDTEETLEDEITDLEEQVVAEILKRTTVMTEESELLSKLKDLERKTNQMNETKTEIKSILYTINFEKSSLTKCATPIIVSLYILSKMGLCAKPSFHNFCEATKRLYDNLEDKESLMFRIYTMFSFQIKENIRSLMSALMSMVRLSLDDKIKEEQIEGFLRISQEVPPETNTTENKETKPDWVSDGQWTLLVNYQLHERVLEKKDTWKSWKENKMEKMTEEEPFFALMISMILNFKGFSSYLIHFVQSVIGFEYLKSDTIIVADVHSFSTPNDPIVFMLECSVEEPSSDLTRLADLQGIASSKVKYLALADENISLAMDLLETAFIRGQWLIFQNVDLVPHFLPILDKRIQEKDDDDVHEDFRVWMTWTNGKLPTFSLLQRAIILSCEPCRDIRYHNSNFLYNIPLKIVRQQEFYQSILFYTFGYLQKVFASRQKFSALCWADSPEFPNFLMQTAYQFFSQYFNITQDNIRRIQYKQLLEWTKEFLYFNHMTNPADRAVISMYLDEYVGQFLFEQHNPFRSSFTTREALEEIITERTEELKNIPKITSGLIMLSPAADRLYQINTSSQTASFIKFYFESRSKFQVLETMDILQGLVKILEKPDQFGEFAGDALVRWQVVRFEIEHTQRAARTILESVDRIDLCLLEGFWPSQETLNTLSYIFRGQTPPAWRNLFPTGGSNLKNWIRQVERIVSYLPSLYMTKEIHVMSISDLPHPPNFFLSLLMETGKHPDKYSLKIDIVDTSKELEQLHSGCYLDRLYLYGGKMQEGELVGGEDGGELWQQLGPVRFTPMQASRMIAARVVQVPLHTRLVLNNEEEKDDPSIIQINMKADLHQSFWTLKKAKFFLIAPTL